MREISFRIRDRITNKWYYGFPRFIYDVNNICMFDSVNDKYFNAFAETDTLGQFTGLCDRNGKKIFEGDIVNGFLFLHGQEINSVVEFKDGAFGLGWNCGEVRDFTAFTSFTRIDFEVIGNIYDNPELIGE